MKLVVYRQNGRKQRLVLFTTKETNMTRKITTLLALTSITCKIMESLIKQKIKETLLEFLKNKNTLPDRQFGLLPGRSTILQLLTILDKWAEALNIASMLMLYTVTS